MSAGDVSNKARTDSEASEVDTSLRELRAECEQAWAQVKDRQQQVEQTRRLHSALSGDQAPLVAILREKERQMRAEVEVAKELEPQTLPRDAQVTEAALMEDLQREVSQLRETLCLVESQHRELIASLEQEQQCEQELTAVNHKLQERCEGLEGEHPPEDAVETVAQELVSKINQIRQTERSVMKRMAAFVTKHFPVPEPDEVAKVSKDLRSKKQQSKKNTMPLKDILLELMTKCVESPSDPYIELTDRHWPAYIELLLRCNIILQHPDNDRRVKLVPFHL
ncbi:centromere protein K-like [Babylonia areolata]|uniref:centromere protein K-like n=1 Tax=Babylonia areolata TaxID=304850 RepID=UPI003FD06F27